jgi:hypothetical protein
MRLRVNDLEMPAESAQNKNTAELLSIFASSINDWPFDLLTVDEFIRSVEETLGAPATKNSLEFYLTNTPPGKDAWKGESIAGLLDIYNHCDVGASLKDILSNLEANIKDGRSAVE